MSPSTFGKRGRFSRRRFARKSDTCPSPLWGRPTGLACGKNAARNMSSRSEPTSRRWRLQRRALVIGPYRPQATVPPRDKINSRLGAPGLILGDIMWRISPLKRRRSPDRRQHLQPSETTTRKDADPGGWIQRPVLIGATEPRGRRGISTGRVERWRTAKIPSRPDVTRLPAGVARSGYPATALVLNG
jgi:hypothetical protein